MNAPDPLLEQVYSELRRTAERKLSEERRDQTLTPTGLVHEAWLRLMEASVEWRDINHFRRLAATAMRRILIDRARARMAEKRGGGLKRVPLDDIAIPLPEERLLALDEAIARLAQSKPQHAELVELKFFGGLSGEEAATLLGVSAATVDRMWRYSRSWLQVAMADSELPSFDVD